MCKIMHIEQFLQQNGTKLIHLSADMQMYQIVMQIKWSFHLDGHTWLYILVGCILLCH